MEKATIEIDKAAQTLKLLGDKTRLTIIALLKNQECCVCELVEILAMSQPSISQHLRKLRDTGIVKERRKGQWIFYSLNPEHETFPIVQDILGYVPDYDEKIKQLENAGLRICCD
ncbi:metalloregulator ArsR/SmtB family transcription factor [Alkalihalobacillus sp. AL-G]|uniref:ArsR/SmtB family transcription factor n=1 Tax=Alkalihalobacillus sp. AL-G TaxID=2926399 RepID=UPI00272A19AE|nr:metalloregulator ArsR/SmtB family transcription factor [Alkalihalobacillus sp. AL-G]WLD92778.1 metalloregulator ArsR/SmtB family transcription factor [Alkalihalobacillus sp. AL-G]